MISFVLFPPSLAAKYEYCINIGIGLLFLNTAPSHWFLRGHMTSNLIPAESL